MLSCGDGVTKELKSLSYKIKLLAQCASEDNSKVNFVEPTKKEWFTTYAKGFGTSDLKITAFTAANSACPIESYEIINADESPLSTEQATYMSIDNAGAMMFTNNNVGGNPLTEFKIKAKSESHTAISTTTFKYKQDSQCANQITKFTTGKTKFQAKQEFYYAAPEDGTSEKLVTFGLFGLENKLANSCTLTCNIRENYAQLKGDDDITFDNNVFMINAKQNKDDGYSRSVIVRCSTDGFLTHTDSEPIEVKQFSRCIGKDAITKKHLDGSTVLM